MAVKRVLPVRFESILINPFGTGFNFYTEFSV